MQRELTDDDQTLLVMYGWGLLWVISFALFTPPTVYPIVSRPATIVWTLMVALGAITAIVGVYVHDNLVVERLGLRLLRVGPLIYAGIQLVLFVLETVQTGTSARGALVVFAIWPAVCLRPRARQLDRQRKDAQRTPLASEPDP